MPLPDRAFLALFPLALVPGLVFGIVIYLEPARWMKFVALFGPRGLPAPWKLLLAFLMVAALVYFFLPKPLHFPAWFFLGVCLLCYTLVALYVRYYAQGIYPLVYYPNVGGWLGRLGVSVISFWLASLPLLSLAYLILAIRVKG